MEKEKLALITQTVEGNEVKSLHFKKVDNLISGLVKDQVTGTVSRDYWVTCCWRLNGSVLPRYGGNSRKDLYLDLSNLK